MVNYIEQKLAPPLVRLSQNRYLVCLQDSFMIVMPFMSLTSFCAILLYLPMMFSSEVGLNLPSVQLWLDQNLKMVFPVLMQVVKVCLYGLPFLVALLNSYFLAKYYQQQQKHLNPFFTSMLSALCLGCLQANPSLISGIIISILVTELYCRLMKYDFSFKLPNNVPPMVGSSLANMIPMTIVVLLVVIIGQYLNVTSILQTVTNFIMNIGSHVISQFIGFILDRTLWFVGIHGSDIVASSMQSVWMSMNIQNIADFTTQSEITYLFSTTWVDSYVRLSVFPIAVLCCLSKVERLKTIGKGAIVGSVFNIAEPIMYGIPIVLNPLMMIPWIFGFGFLFIFNAILTLIGIIPPVVCQVVWTMPVPLMAYVGSGFNITALLISIFNLLMLFLIFLPFFKMMEKQERGDNK